jgi:hypothetical protein
MIPLIPLAVGATVAGVAFAVGKRLADNVLIPFANQTAKEWGRGWSDLAEETRKRKLDDIDPPGDTG